MVARTNAEITALMADNTPSRLISEADMRDLWDTTVARSRRISVKQHGALGNGSANDTAAIQACINAVASDGGGTAFIPAGIYMINAGIEIQNRVLVEGEYGGTLIRMMNSSNLNGMFFTAGTDAMTGLRNICLDGNRNFQSGKVSCALRVNHSAKSASFGTSSIIGGEIEEAYGIFQNIMIAGVDGTGVRTTGSRAFFDNITVIQVNGKAFECGSVNAQWVNCSMNGCAEEGFLCSGQDSTYINCTAGFAGTGGIGGTFGNYAFGAGFRITAPYQAFFNTQAIDVDGPGFLIESSHTHLGACYVTQGCNLTGTSASIGQSPIRGGGWEASGARRSAFEIRGNTSYCMITGHAKDKLVTTANEPDLDAAVIIDGGDGNLINVGGDPRILATVGSTPWVLNEGTNTTILHNYNGAI